MQQRTDHRSFSDGMQDVAGIAIRHLCNPAPINLGIYEQYLYSVKSDGVIRSNYFGGRYENVYLEPVKVPAVNTVLTAAKDYACSFLQADGKHLKVGFWFNDMQPGDCTTMHCHDEFDELLSGVYYVRVPADSGNLVIWKNGHRIEIEPEEGMFVFFAPDLMHEVLVNNSGQRRLSLGLNIGGVLPRGIQSGPVGV